MRTVNFQNRIDGVIDKIFLRFIPSKVRPNQITYIRFLTLPIIYYLFFNHYYLAGLLAFILSASTDFIDGALARTRNQVTDVGKVIDPIADKLLIGLMLYFIGIEYLIVKIFLFVISIEIIANLVSGLAYKTIGRPVGANVFGKMKMILQSFAIFIFTLGVLLKIDPLIAASEWVLFVALAFACLAGIKQILIRFGKRKPAH